MYVFFVKFALPSGVIVIIIIIIMQAYSYCIPVETLPCSLKSYNRIAV